MTDPGQFRVSQGFDVLQPKTGRAYPVPCDEWDFIKRKLGEVSAEPWEYHTAGSLLAGIGLSTLVTILSGTFPSASSSPAIIIAWSVVTVSFICALACFYFANQQRKVQGVRISDVVTQMELIERRYEAGLPGESASSTTLKIVSGRYGANGQFVDLTAILTSRLSHGTLSVTVGNDLAGDPCPRVAKELVLEYELDGKRLTKTVKEHDVLTLP